MNHNDRLTRLRYALDIRDDEMVRIFELGGYSLNENDIYKLLKKTDSENFENEYEMECSDEMLERFLNGLITSRRGARGTEEPELELTQENANNLFLKKVKIALSLTSDDILKILEDADLVISKNELSAVLRREGHRNYKPCGDRYIRNFLKGLTINYRQ